MSFVGFKAKNHKQQVKKRGADDSVDDRRTPAEIFDPLNKFWRFTLDAAASKENAKVPRYFDIATNGLEQSWVGEFVWCNPPYSDIASWVEKAFYEMKRGCRAVVFLLPANRCEQKWWQEMIEPVRDRFGSGVTTRFLSGRPRFGRPGVPTPPKGDRPPFGLVVIEIDGVP